MLHLVNQRYDKEGRVDTNYIQNSGRFKYTWLNRKQTAHTEHFVHLAYIPQILYGVQVRRVGRPIEHSNTMVSKPFTSGFGTVSRCQVVLKK